MTLGVSCLTSRLLLCHGLDLGCRLQTLPTRAGVVQRSWLHARAIWACRAPFRADEFYCLLTCDPASVMLPLTRSV
jgi:hypothetical protein